LSKGPKQLRERVPIAVGTIQVNFCKNPQCQNFGIAASTKRQPRGPGAAQRGRDTYTVVGSGRGTPMLRCSFCGQYPTIKSNKAIHDSKKNGVRSLKLAICRFVPGFDEIVFSIYDLISVWFSDALGFG
jgi:hypothetical protein